MSKPSPFYDKAWSNAKFSLRKCRVIRNWDKNISSTRLANLSTYEGSGKHTRFQLAGCETLFLAGIFFINKYLLEGLAISTLLNKADHVCTSLTDKLQSSEMQSYFNHTKTLD